LSSARKQLENASNTVTGWRRSVEEPMSDGGRIASLIAQLIFAIFLLFCGIHWWIKDYAQKDEPFADYENLEDCVMRNQNKRDPEQYCRKIRSKVQRARRRKRGR